MKPYLKKGLITVLAMMSLSAPVTLAGPRPLRSTPPNSSSTEQQGLTPEQKKIARQLERSPEYKKLTPDIKELATKDPTMYRRYGNSFVLYDDERIFVNMNSGGMISQARASIDPETDALGPLTPSPYGTQSYLKIPTDEIEKLSPADQEYITQGLIPALNDIYAYFYDVPFATMTLKQIMDGESNGKYIPPHILLRGDPVDSDEHPAKTTVFDSIGRPVYNLGDFVDLDKVYYTGFCGWTNGHGWTKTKKEKKGVQLLVLHRTTPQIEEDAKKLMEVIYEVQANSIRWAIRDIQPGVKKILAAKGMASTAQARLTPTQKIIVDLTSQFEKNLENLTKLKALEFKNPNARKVGYFIPLGFFGDATPKTLHMAHDLEKSHKYPKEIVFFKDTGSNDGTLVENSGETPKKEDSNRGSVENMSARPLVENSGKTPQKVYRHPPVKQFNINQGNEK